MGARDLIAKALAGIKAFHSSPHDFDKFDLSKIGTGEGAQVYGHGLYFAESPAVSGQGGQYWKQFLGRFPETEQQAASRLRAESFDRSAAAASTRRDVDDWAREIKRYQEMPDSAKSIDDWNRQAQALKMFEERSAQYKLLESGKPVGPRTYEVNINADPARMLDWDKPLKDQPYLHDFARHVEPSQKPGARSRVMLDKWREGAEQADYPLTGDAFHRAISWNDPVRASSQMREAGIPGIKYLDEGSRGIPAAITDIESAIKRGGMYKGAGPDMWASRLDELKQTPLTNNYVVFDPSIVDIRRKFAAPAAVGGTAAMGALANQDSYEVQ